MRGEVGMSDVRILVTGSRDWRDIVKLRTQMHIACARYLPSAIVIVHGDCPHGADRLADVWAKHYHLRTEPHPADWKTHGKRAGFIRNAAMVELGADLCLAFIRNGSNGATHTADLAEKAGIPVRRFTQEA
jgi:hypothetical protein